MHTFPVNGNRHIATIVCICACVCVFLVDILLIQTNIGRPADWLLHTGGQPKLGGGKEREGERVSDKF